MFVQRPHTQTTFRGRPEISVRPPKDRRYQTALSGSPDTLLTSSIRSSIGADMPAGYVPRSAAGARSYRASSVATLYHMGPTNSMSRDYQPGNIIWTLHSVPNLDRYATAEDVSVSVNRTGITTVTKQRPFVVIGVTDTHLKCIPMYTSKGSGFFRQPERKQWECIWLRQFQDDADWWHGLTSDDFLMVTESSSMKDGSYLNWTRSVDVEYEWPIKASGALTKASLNRVQEMYRIALDMGVLNSRDQREWASKRLKAIPVTDEYDPICTTLPQSSTCVMTASAVVEDFSRTSIKPQITSTPNDNTLNPRTMTGASASGMSYSEVARSKRPSEIAKIERRSSPPQDHRNSLYQRATGAKPYPCQRTELLIDYQ